VVSLIFKFIAMSLKAAISFRMQFLVSGISMVITNTTLFLPLYLLAVQNGELGGFTPEQILLGVTISVLTFVLGVNFTHGIMDLQTFVLNGKLDLLLLRPIGLYKHILISRINGYMLGEIMTVIILLFLNSPANYLFIFTASIIGAVLMNHAMLLYELTPLYFTQQYEHTVSDTIITFSIYPPTVFPDIAKFIALYIVPGGLVSYGALLGLLNPSFWFVFIGFTIFIVILTHTLLHFGIKRYTGAGY